MPSKIYCRNSSKAEIYIEDSRGRELFFESLAPPVEVIWGEKMYVYPIVIGVYSDLSNTYYEKSPIRVLLRKFESYDEILGYTGYVYRLNLTSPNTFFERPLQIILEKHSTGGIVEVIRRIAMPKPIFGKSGQLFYSFANGQFSNYVEDYNLAVDGFAIQDTEGVIFFVEENLEKPLTYRVQCVDCPEGLCAVRGRDDIVCLDCERVKSSLGRIESVLDDLLGG